MIYIFGILILFGLDQGIKRYIEKKTSLRSKTPILQGNVILTKCYNKGAFLGIFKEKTVFLKGINLVVVGGLVIYFLKEVLEKGSHIKKFALMFLLGGALSNVYDRFRRHYVIDYFFFRRLKKVVFNLGDMFIFLGTFLLFIHSLFSKK